MSNTEPDRQCDWLINNANLISFANQEHSYGVMKNVSVGLKHGKIVLVEASNQCQTSSSNQLDARGRWLTPGLIDCHTHLVFGGNRAQEFEWRLQGESYQSIARRGGGIISSVMSTRALSEQELFDQSAPRLERLLEEGVTTIEIKSGYGLDTENEIKMLRVARNLQAAYPVTVRTSFLGAHAVPPEFKDLKHGKQAYVDHICDEMMPAIIQLNLADAVDVFCEGIGFSVEQCKQIFIKAGEYGLPIKGHVEQLSNQHGALAAAQYQALSVDHLEYLTQADVAALTNTVAVMLPAAYYYLNETQKPPIDALREYRIPMAVATDLNPGTAPVASLLTAINQACVLFGLTPEESLRGATINAAKALGLSTKGAIATGLDADILLWNIQEPAELAYAVNFHRPDCIWQNGQLVRGEAT